MNSSDFASKKITSRCPQSGRSMIEMLGVLAIIGVLSVGGIAGYSKAMQKYRINKAIEQITLIAGNVRAFFAPQGNYVGVDNKTVLRKAKIIPDEMWEYNDDGTFKQFTNVFGYGVDLGSADKSKVLDYRAFKLKYHIPTKDVDICIELLTYDWSSVGVNGFGTDGWYASFIKAPLELETAINYCTTIAEKYIKIPYAPGGPENTGGIYLIFLFDSSGSCIKVGNLVSGHCR